MLRELAELREDARALAAGLALLRHRRVAGLPPQGSLREILKAHPLAASRDGLAQVREALGNALAEEPRRPGRVARLTALRDFLVQVRALALEPGAAQELFELPQRPLVRPPGDAGLHGALPAVAVERELPLLRERDKRAGMERALAEALGPADATRSAWWEAAEAALGEAGVVTLGTASGVRVGTGSEVPVGTESGDTKRGAAAHHVPDAVAGSHAVAASLLDRTEALATDLGGWLLERHTGAKRYPGGAERHDVLHLIEAPRCASAFPRGELVRTVRRWAEMFSLDLTSDGAIRLDEDDRPLKWPGAHVEPIDPPWEVALTVLPEEGPRALSRLLAAIGVAQLRAGPPSDAPPEDLWLGDPVVLHALAALFEGLVREPEFLRRCARADLSRDDERALAIAGVIDARLSAARALGSLQAHESGLGSRAVQAYRELYARAAGAELPAGLALRELDPFTPAAELQGRSLAARLRAFLRDRFDEDWWRNPRSLASLNAVWGRGGRSTPAELWAQLGDEPGPDALADELIHACR